MNDELVRLLIGGVLGAVLAALLLAAARVAAMVNAARPHRRPVRWGWLTSGVTLGPVALLAWALAYQAANGWPSGAGAAVGGLALVAVATELALAVTAALVIAVIALLRLPAKWARERVEREGGDR